MTLCPDCRKASDDWLDYRPVHPIRIATVATSARWVIEAQKARAEDTRNLIRSQQKLIADICAANHSPQEDT